MEAKNVKSKKTEELLDEDAPLKKPRSQKKSTTPVSHIFSKHKQHNNNFLAESIMKFPCGSCIDIGT